MSGYFTAEQVQAWLVASCEAQQVPVWVADPGGCWRMWRCWWAGMPGGGHAPNTPINQPTGGPKARTALSHARNVRRRPRPWPRPYRFDETPHRALNRTDDDSGSAGSVEGSSGLARDARTGLAQ